MFIRNQEKNGNTYYKINAKRFRQVKATTYPEFYEIKDLLLDLDAEDCKYVREFTETDETQAEKRAKDDPTRKRIQGQLESFKEQLYWSRRKHFEVTSQASNVWRLGTHDILSAALQGSPKTSLSPSSHTNRSGSATTQDDVEVVESADATPWIFLENGLPTQGRKNDETLMTWLRLRQNAIESRQRYSDTRQTLGQVKTALSQQNSIAGIRRLVFQSLSSGHDEKAISHPLSAELRTACLNALDQTGSTQSGIQEVLALLGSLNERLSTNQSHLGGPLCGLGLRLSAQILKPEITLEYLWLGFLPYSWGHDSETRGDILYTLMTYSRHLRCPTRDSCLTAFQRQVLLEVMTGVREEKVHEESFRTLATVAFLEDRDAGLQNALALYRAYIMLLGEVGAMATLWKEWRLSAPVVEDRIGHEQVRLSSGYGVTDAFISAVKAALPIIVPHDEALPRDLDLAECVTVDSRAIEAQSPDHWLGNQQEKAFDVEGLNDGDIRGALELPLGRWLETVGRLGRGVRP